MKLCHLVDVSVWQIPVDGYLEDAIQHIVQPGFFQTNVPLVIAVMFSGFTVVIFHLRVSGWMVKNEY